MCTMKILEEKILSDGKVLDGNILKVGNFLNQQIDTELLRQIGDEIAGLFEDEGITRILTIESSGIAMAVAAGMAMGIPVIFAKKHRSSNVDGDVYCTQIHSFTHGNDYDAVVSRDYISSDDRVLLVDDFLASGNALNGLAALVEQAGAELAGAAIAIEKKFQGGGDELRRRGVRIESLACIESMEEGHIKFCQL